MAVGRVHLFYGLAGSGKTTLARELSSDGRGVRFTLDERMCGGSPHTSPSSVDRPTCTMTDLSEKLQVRTVTPEHLTDLHVRRTTPDAGNVIDVAGGRDRTPRVATQNARPVEPPDSRRSRTVTRFGG